MVNGGMRCAKPWEHWQWRFKHTWNTFQTYSSRCAKFQKEFLGSYDQLIMSLRSNFAHAVFSRLMIKKSTGYTWSIWDDQHFGNDGVRPIQSSVERSNGSGLKTSRCCSMSDDQQSPLCDTLEKFSISLLGKRRLHRQNDQDAEYANRDPRSVHPWIPECFSLNVFIACPPTTVTTIKAH